MLLEFDGLADDKIVKLAKSFLFGIDKLQYLSLGNNNIEDEVENIIGFGIKINKAIKQLHISIYFT